MMKELMDKASMRATMVLLLGMTVCGLAVLEKPVPEVLVAGFGAMIGFLFVEQVNQARKK